MARIYLFIIIFKYMTTARFDVVFPAALREPWSRKVSTLASLKWAWTVSFISCRPSF